MTCVFAFVFSLFSHCLSCFFSRFPSDQCLRRAQPKERAVCIVSKDKDLLQLVDDQAMKYHETLKRC